MLQWNLQKTEIIENSLFHSPQSWLKSFTLFAQFFVCIRINFAFMSSSYRWKLFRSVFTLFHLKQSLFSLCLCIFCCCCLDPFRVSSLVLRDTLQSTANTNVVGYKISEPFPHSTLTHPSHNVVMITFTFISSFIFREVFSVQSSRNEKRSWQKWERKGSSEV